MGSRTHSSGGGPWWRGARPLVLSDASKLASVIIHSRRLPWCSTCYKRQFTNSVTVCYSKQIVIWVYDASKGKTRSFLVANPLTLITVCRTTCCQ
jgi:hypothetical protein